MCTLDGLQMCIWPLFLGDDITRPLLSAKKPGVICQTLPDLDIHLVFLIGPEARDTATVSYTHLTLPTNREV